jgi:hypothetical protein
MSNTTIIDQESGIAIRSNGSEAGNSFMKTFLEVSAKHNNLEQSRKQLINNKYGFVYFVPCDGWATKCKQKGHDSYEGHFANYPLRFSPNVGELVCVGDIGWELYVVIYQITKVEHGFIGLATIYGEELEVFNFEEGV